MSHFAVAVFTKKKPTEYLIDEMLEPFWEGDGSQDENWPNFIKSADDDYYYNPDAKWDWYVIGGRWQNRLKVKEGCEYFNLNTSIHAQDVPGWTNTCHVSSIDFEGMRAKKLEDLTPYEKVAKEGWWKEEYFRKMYPTEAEYIERETTFTTYAVLTPDGEWIALGEMGWWGFSSDTPEEQREWDRNYHKFFEQFADCYITVVDCHI